MRGGILTELARVNCQAGYASLLQWCADPRLLPEAKLVHAHVARHPVHSRSLLLRNHIVHAYARCGSLADARAAFDAIPAKNVFSWSIIIAAYARHGHYRQALDLFDHMEANPSAAPLPNAFVLSTALGACSALRDLDRGERIHSRIQQRRGDLGENLVVLETALLKMYASCGCVLRAEKIFQAMGDRDVIAWNAIISAYAQAGHHARAFWIFRAMLLEAAVAPSAATFSAILAASVDLGSGEKIHRLAASIGVDYHPSVAISLLGMYSRCRSITSARAVFEGMERKTLVAWNTMIIACARRGLAADAQELFEAMDVEPDGFTFASIVGVCCDLELGRRLHTQITAARLEPRLIVDTALVGMYARCGSLGDAAAVFERMEDRDTVAWNAMMAAFSEVRDLDRALECYHRMVDQSTCAPNGITYATLLAACRGRGDLGHGRRLLTDATDRGLLGEDPDRSVQSAAVAMLARCGALYDARQLLGEAKIRNVTAWNAMISAYTQLGHLHEALGIYRDMELDGSSSPDLFTFASALAAAAGIGDLDTGKAIHERMAADRSLKLDVFAGNALLTMYSKCGSLGDAKLVFDRIPDKDAVSWNSMISAYARHGRYKEAIATYRAMDSPPDEATIVSALAAASALADLNEGSAIHARALELGIATPAVVSALASMHAKCGSLDAAMALFEEIRDKDLVSWNAMVAACAQHGDGSEAALGLIQRMELEGISPNGVTLSGVLASCSHAGLLERGLFYMGWLSQEHGVAVESEHYRFVVELLGRCGRLGDAEAVAHGMPLEPDPTLWATLVAACVLHEEVGVADRAAGGLDPGDAASYVLLANVYSAVNC